jgi:hypothetical protein
MNKQMKKNKTNGRMSKQKNEQKANEKGKKTNE